MAIITYQSRHSGEHIDNQIDAVNNKLDKTGTAVAADKLSAKRNIQLIGSVQGSAEFDGSDNIKIDTVVMNDSHSHEKVTKADRLDIPNIIGSETTPVYFVAGYPVALTYSLNATVPYDAKFTDTTYSEATQTEPGLMSQFDKSKLDHIADGATANIGDITSVIAGNGLTGGATSGDATLSLATSGVTAGTYGPSADVTGSNGSTISVPQITVDSFGRVTSVANRTFTASNTNTKVTNTLSTTTKFYITGTSSSSTNTGTQYFDTGVYVDSTAGVLRATKVYGAVWNDYAEYRNQIQEIEPGYCVTSSRDGKVSKTTEKLEYCEGVVSDTFGFAIGETDECKTPIAISGRVLVYFNGNIEDYNIGDVVCAGPNGKVCKMTREEVREWPDRIIGTVSEFPTYETWGSGDTPVNRRIWIKVK